MCCQLFPRNTSGILMRLWLDEFSAALRSSRHILSQKRLNLNDTALHKGVCLCVCERGITGSEFRRAWLIDSFLHPASRGARRAWEEREISGHVWSGLCSRIGMADPWAYYVGLCLEFYDLFFFFFFFHSDGWCGLIWDWWEFGFLGIWNYLWPLLSVSWGLTDVQTVRILDDRFCCDTVKRTWYSWDIKLEGYTLRSISVYIFIEIVFKIVST